MILYNAVRNRTDIIQTGSIIKEFVENNKMLFGQYLKEHKNDSQNNGNLSSSKKDHAEWFKGQPEYLTTKEQVMARRSQDRIRGYFYKAKDDIMRSDLYLSNRKGRHLLTTVIEVFKVLLTGVEYFSTYFNRHCSNKHRSVINADDHTDGETPRKKLKEQIKQMFNKRDLSMELCVSLCNNNGEFLCEGVWNENQCTYNNHKINPYTSRENAILFQIWNLDHQIELSRSIIPSLLNSVREIVNGTIVCRRHGKKCVNISILTYFFEIFTVRNLKFVHIVCHDKGTHELKSNGGVICEECDEFHFIENILTISKQI